jgi:hypothetical protein
MEDDIEIEAAARLLNERDGAGLRAAKGAELAGRTPGLWPLAGLQTPVLGGMVSSLVHVLIVTFMWLRAVSWRTGKNQERSEIVSTF